MSYELNSYLLGDIATFQYGKMPKKPLLGTGLFPTYSGYKYQYLYPEFNCDAGDVIVVARGVGGTGDVKIVKEKCYLTNLSIKISLDNKIVDNRFFYYMFMKNNLRYLDSGSAQSQITINDLKILKIELPCLSAQKKVVKILSELDDKIEVNTQTNQVLELIAQAIFKSWFVDFDPVKAKIETLATGGSADDAELAAMRVISAKTLDELNGLKASNSEAFNKLAQTAALFPAAMQDSELGEIPEGWEVVRVGDIVKRLKPSKRYTKKQVEPHGKIPVYEQGAGILLGFHNDDAGFEANPKEPIFIFGDHTCVTHLSCSSFDISSNVIPLKGSVRPTIWTYFAIQGKQEFQEYRRHWSELIIKDIVLPSKQLAEVYTELVTTKYLMIESFQRESKELELLRDMLLPKLLSGEIDLTSEVTA